MWFVENTSELTSYIAAVEQRKGSCLPHVSSLVDGVLCWLRSMGGLTRGGHPRLSELMENLWEGKSTMAEVFSGEEFEALVILLGKEWADKFRVVWDRCTAYTYSSGLESRPFRTTYEVAYLDKGFSMLCEMCVLVSRNFTYERHFKGLDTVFGLRIHRPVVAHLLAVEIDKDNEQVTSRIRELVYGENSAGLLSSEVIHAMFLSNSPVVHRWVGDLFLAARLQEGLRQSILEKADMGSREAFLHILELILKHNMVRFSSVIRAIDVWAGLGLSAAGTSTAQKCLEAGFRCLTEPVYRRECLEGRDSLLIYMALWAVAFEDVSSLVEPVRVLLSSPHKHQRLTALGFLSQVQQPLFQHSLALPMLEDSEPEVRAWAVENVFFKKLFASLDPVERDLWISKLVDRGENLRETFFRLKKVLDGLPRKTVTHSPSIFPWWNITLTSPDILEKMMYCVAKRCDTEADMLDVLLQYRHAMSPSTRQSLVALFKSSPQNSEPLKAVLEFLGDRSQDVRNAAWKIVDNMTLSMDDYKNMEDLLRYKAGDLRKRVIMFLLKLKPDQVVETIERLARDKDGNKHLAALDMIHATRDDARYDPYSQQLLATARRLADSSHVAGILSQKVTNADVVPVTLETGLGLFDPNSEVELPSLAHPQGFLPAKELVPTLPRVVQICRDLDHLVTQNRNYEYETEFAEGGTEKVVLGADFVLRPTKSCSNRQRTLDHYPLPEVWRNFAREHGLSTPDILSALFCLERGMTARFEHKADWAVALLDEVFGQRRGGLRSKLRYYNHVSDILYALLRERPRHEAFDLSLNVCKYLFSTISSELFARIIPEERSPRSSVLLYTEEIKFWFRILKELAYDDASFADAFYVTWAVFRAAEFAAMGFMELEHIERAFSLGLIGKDEVLKSLVLRPMWKSYLPLATDVKPRPYANAELRSIYKNLGQRIASIELDRGDRSSSVTHIISSIRRFYGAEIFARVLIGAEKEAFTRGFNSLYHEDSRMKTFSYLLKHCYPAEGDDEHTLRRHLEGFSVPINKLLDACLLAPQWLEIVEQYLQWPGLKSAGWYFHAHTSEDFYSEEKIAVVSRYSPINIGDFRTGAFDMTWFMQAYTSLGEERFRQVYTSARYIGGGALHRRSQLFSDAVLGRLNTAQVETVISQKRNKDYVLCYGLLPLTGGKEEALRRYEFLHRFLQESKQYGVTRRESEGKAVAMALQNLSRNAGFSDLSRFTWYMESEKVSEAEPYFRPAQVREYDVSVVIDVQGRASLSVHKGGKVFKSVPAEIRDDGYVKSARAMQKSLNAQHSRARSMLETAMTMGEEFTGEELLRLSRHPVICPLLSSLLFVWQEKPGYYRDGNIVSADGIFSLHSDDRCLIAHPVHLFESGQWSSLQRDLYERQIKQPFKQVFRELYRPTTDETEHGFISRRYAGHQIQPRKAVALLRSRGWTVGHRTGMQKVFYSEDVVAEINCMADWLSPSEVEAPTLEGVSFVHRHTGRPVAFSNISPVIFSEVMRDLDLVVSVAHVGGVDPEASLSTVEMRAAIVAEISRLFKLSNVEPRGSHVFINGSLGEYTVHLGSGVVHMMARGALDILPVHSQHRGRIFLPFIDEDPRTAEICSKVLLLAEDKKIKDPGILAQIGR